MAAAGPILLTFQPHAMLPEQKSNDIHSPANPHSTKSAMGTSAQSMNVPTDDLKAPTASAPVHDEGDTAHHDIADPENAATETIGHDDLVKEQRQRKKPAHFPCTDYPPCALSFTRSEHLARHVRKHTGERPFQCFCGHKFSRLDNLRQHAQTVHVKGPPPVRQAESDVPELPAIGNRPERARTIHGQMRPVLQPNRRAILPRGHSRTQSTSSIVPDIDLIGSPTEESRKRPRSSLLLSEETLGAIPLPSTFAASLPYARVGPSTFVPGSPVPLRMLNGSASFAFNASGCNTARRQSVPAASLYGSDAVQDQPRQCLVTLPAQNNNQPNSHITQKTGSEQAEAEAESDWRRRTWHADSAAAYARKRPSSGLINAESYDTVEQTPSACNSVIGHVTRLPGIESFDQVPRTHATNTNPHPAAMQSFMTSPAAVSMHNTIVSAQRQGIDQYRGYGTPDHGLNRGLDRLELTNAKLPQHCVQSGLPNDELQDQNQRPDSTSRFSQTANDKYGRVAYGMPEPLRHTISNATASSSVPIHSSGQSYAPFSGGFDPYSTHRRSSSQTQDLLAWGQRSDSGAGMYEEPPPKARPGHE